MPPVLKIAPCCGNDGDVMVAGSETPTTNLILQAVPVDTDGKSECRMLYSTLSVVCCLEIAVVAHWTAGQQFE